MNINGKTLYRNPQNKMIGGVCSGLAEFFNIDVSLMRLLWVLALFFVGASLWIYIAALIIVPEKPLYYDGSQQGPNVTQPREGAKYDPYTGAPLDPNGYQNGDSNGPTGI